MKDDLYSPEMVDYSLDTARDLLPEYARYQLAYSLSLLPEDIIDFVCDNLIFMSEEKKTQGGYYSFNNIFFKNRKGFILIHDSQWRKKGDKNHIQITFLIAHEVAHAFKNHEIRTFDDMTLEKGKKWEIEADMLAVEWLSKHYEKEDLMKLCNSDYGKNKLK